MKIEFIKKHLDHKEGDTLETTDSAGNYLVAMGVAKVAGKKATKEAEEVKEKAAKVEATEKKKDAGPNKAK